MAQNVTLSVKASLSVLEASCPKVTGSTRGHRDKGPLPWRPLGVVASTNGQRKKKVFDFDLILSFNYVTGFLQHQRDNPISWKTPNFTQEIVFVYLEWLQTQDMKIKCNIMCACVCLCLSFFFFSFLILGLHLPHKEVPRLGVESEAYTTATATPDLSHICDLLMPQLTAVLDL